MRKGFNCGPESKIRYSTTTTTTTNCCRVIYFLQLFDLVWKVIEE